MCLKVKRGCKPHIATSDIVCYKVVEMTESGSRWRSPYEQSVQLYNRRTRAMDYGGLQRECCEPITELHINDFDEILCGLHAFVDYDRAEVDMMEWRFARPRNKFIVRTAVIPKGAECCLGMNGDIVATEMIVFGSTVSYLKYWGKENKTE